MIENTVFRNGEKIVEVRSEGGKLLYVKTQEGYEMKCPRTKQICVIKYNQMLFDCLKCFSDNSDDDYLMNKTKEIRQLLSTP